MHGESQNLHQVQHLIRARLVLGNPVRRVVEQHLLAAYDAGQREQVFSLTPAIAAIEAAFVELMAQGESA